MSGTLTLIPTPIEDESLLASDAVKLLNDNCLSDNSILLVEELKPCRRRWLHYGLPREAIEKFELYNEHNQVDTINSMIKELKKGKNIYLMSDCGLPAFCDPGKDLVDACHNHKIKVTSTSFCNSIVLAVALSGFNHSEFYFGGFIPAKKPERIDKLKKILEKRETIVLMDTPYRLGSLLNELKENMGKKRKIFVATELNKPQEKLYRGSIETILKSMPKEKSEFIIVLDKL